MGLRASTIAYMDRFALLLLLFFLFFELGIENVALNAFISSQGWYLSHPTGITFPPRSCRQVICSACRSLQAACYSHMRGYILVVFAEQVCQISARPICSALPWRQMPMWWLCSACIIGQRRKKKKKKKRVAYFKSGMVWSMFAEDQAGSTMVYW